MQPVHITQYRWAGSWGPFAIKVPCGECGLTEGIIHDVIEHEFAGLPITFEVKDWLPNWWRIVLRGAWHAPIVMVNNTVVMQGGVIDRGLLAFAIRRALNPTDEPTGNAIFYKDGCKYCAHAKEVLDSRGVSYEKLNVIANPLQAQRMFVIAKRYLGDRTPVTVPQIWLEGKYIGGADQLDEYFAIGKAPQDAKDTTCAV